MPSRWRTSLHVVAALAASLVYWTVFLFVAYSLTAGDYRDPAAAPSDAQRSSTALIVWIAGAAIYAAAMTVWWRLARAGRSS